MLCTLINCAVRPSRTLRDAYLPQGCLYLLAAAERAGHEVVFRDYQVAEYGDTVDASTFAAFLDDESDLVAISCMSNMLPLAIEAARLLKLSHPQKSIVLGGIGPTGVAERLMAAFNHVDLVCKGEGEHTFAELLSALEQGQSPASVPGVVARSESGGLHETKPRNRVLNLDSLGEPAYHRVNMHQYQTAGVQTARGCPYPCTFCDVSAYWGRRMSHRSVSSVLDEIELLETHYGFRKVNIVDDTFILQRSRVAAFCRGRKERGLSAEWGAFCRVDLLDEALIDTLEDAGCRRVFLGVESGSDRVLQRIAKPIDRSQLARVVRSMATRFVVRCNLIWGFPFETLDDLRETVLLALYLKELACDVSLALVSPLPMSTLYKQWGHTLVLRQDVQSSVVSSRVLSEASSRSVSGKPPRLVELIRRHPDVFPGFYVFQDVKFDEKLELLRSHGLVVEALACS